MISQHHIVKRQIFEFTLPDEQGTGELQDLISRICRRRIIPILDKHCTLLSSPDVVHRIEKLELDLGTLSPVQLEERLAEAFERLFATGLAQAILTHSQRLKEKPDARLEARESNNDFMSAPAAGLTAPPLESSIPHQLELLAYYLTSGTLPWWADLGQGTPLQGTLKLLIQHAPRQLLSMLQQFSTDEHVLRRLVRTYDVALLDRLFGIMAPAVQSMLPGFGTNVAYLFSLISPTSGWRSVDVSNLVWEETFCVATAENASASNASKFFLAVLQQLSSRLGIADSQIVHDLHRMTEPRRREFPQEFVELIENLHYNTSSAVSPRTPTTMMPVSDSRDELCLEFSDSNEVFIGNAGLIILWPFVEQFFIRVGLLEQKHFKNDAAKHRGVGLLQYVVSQDDAPQEYLLPLNKVLCGLDVMDVFDFGPPVTNVELAQCEDFLGAVIARAPILRNTSPPAFRAAFLLRKGQLSCRNGAWLLRVERQPHDLLLERLPWSLSRVKLPWMHAPIQVEW